MVFLKKEKGSKTKMISKRSAVYFGRSNDEISYIYDQIKQAYSDRSNYIHEGIEPESVKLSYFFTGTA